MMSKPLWTGGNVSANGRTTLFRNGTFETYELKAGMVFWDLHLTNYSHVFFFGSTCSRKRAVAHQALVMAEKGDAVYTLAQHQSLVRQGMFSEAQAADTHTS